MDINRKDALELFKEWIDSDRLTKHCLAVEGAMRGCAEYYDEDVEEWGVCGLLHDIDFQKYPNDEHLEHGPKILKEAGYPEYFIEAVKGHGDFTNTPRETKMAKSLYAVDQLASFIVAVALVRPTKLEGMKYKSVKKKVKDKAFAKAVDRDEMKRGAEELGIEFSDLVMIVVKALQKREEQLNSQDQSLF